MTGTVPSPITGAPSRYLFTATVLGRHEARYYLDPQIEYIFVHEPHWLDEAYSDAIALMDTGILARNTTNIAKVTRILDGGRLPFERGVDLGAGYGLFVRGMRDAGFDFYWTDKYAENLLARGFEAGPGQYDVAVAFEVLEHLPDPATFLAEARDAFGFHTLFFSAEVFDPANIPGRDWWYWVFETGQHISFFSVGALRAIGSRLGLELYHLGGPLYAFSAHDLRRGTHLSRRISALLPRRPRASLTIPDHDAMRDRLRKR